MPSDPTDALPRKGHPDMPTRAAASERCMTDDCIVVKLPHRRLWLLYDVTGHFAADWYCDGRAAIKERKRLNAGLIEPRFAIQRYEAKP